MANIEFGGLEVYRKKLRELERGKADAAIRFAVYPAAGVVAEEIRRNVPEESGDLRRSLVLMPMRDEAGYINTKVYFEGYDRNGVPNQLKARAIESGHSLPYRKKTQPKVGKHPFVRPAVNRVHDRAVALMQTALDQYFYKIMRK